jgi:TPR repeat protein
MLRVLSWRSIPRAVVRALVCAALALLPVPSAAQPHVQDELNRAKAAMQLKKFDEAAARFEKLARAGNAVAQFYMGRLTAMGAGVQKDMPKAVEWFRQSAEQGYFEAEAVLGYHYMQGLGVAQSYAEAARWSQRAADKGHGGAAYNLARMYVKGGAGLAADRGQAERWAKIAMAKGFPEPLKDRPDQPARTDDAVALFNEGVKLYKAGDVTGAVREFRRCASTGDSPCQLQLGWHFEEGKGVAKNLGEAVRWYRAAAEQHNPKAADNLGNMYQLGRGVAKNCKTAVEWYARGALQNDHPSLYSLARMYQYGFGVKEDRAKAHALYRQAAALGNGKAREALATFDRFSVPDRQSAAIYDQRVTAYMSAINGCQAQANQAGHAVTCLVPVVDWNPKTWQDC